MDRERVAGLPDAGEASFIPVMAVFGALCGSAIARARGSGRDDIRRWTEDGAFLGALFGLIFYLATLVLGLS